MLVKDYASLEAAIDKGEPTRLLIEIALRPAFPAGAAPAADPGEVQRAIRDGFREVLAQVEHERLAKPANPAKSRGRRWFGRALAFTVCAAIGSMATLLLWPSHTAPQNAVGSTPPPPAEHAAPSGFEPPMPYSHSTASPSIEAPSPGSQSTGGPATSSAAPTAPPTGPATFGLHEQ